MTGAGLSSEEGRGWILLVLSYISSSFFMHSTFKPFKVGHFFMGKLIWTGGGGHFLLFHFTIFYNTKTLTECCPTNKKVFLKRYMRPSGKILLFYRVIVFCCCFALLCYIIFLQLLKNIYTLGKHLTYNIFWSLV